MIVEKVISIFFRFRVLIVMKLCTKAPRGDSSNQQRLSAYSCHLPITENPHSRLISTVHRCRRRGTWKANHCRGVGLTLSTSVPGDSLAEGWGCWPDFHPFPLLPRQWGTLRGPVDPEHRLKPTDLESRKHTRIFGGILELSISFDTRFP